MEKLDRLGWAAGQAYEAFGVRFGIRSDSEESLRAAESLLPPGTDLGSDLRVEFLFSLRLPRGPGRAGARPFNLAYFGPARIARTLDREAALAALEQEIALKVAEFAPERIFVHAGVVGWRGQAILIPGRTFTGKSTLTRALLDAGATYYSDEYALLDEQGRVYPYPRPLSLRAEGGMPPRRMLPQLVGSGPIPVGLVVVTEYRAGARWRPRTLTAGQALLALLDNTVPARTRPEASMTALRRVMAAASALKGARGEADQTAERILNKVRPDASLATITGCSPVA